MKKIIMYSVLFIAIAGTLVYFFGSNGLLASILGLFGLAGKKYSDQMKQLDEKIKDQEKDVKALEEKRKNMEVKEKSLQEEQEYWKNQ